MYALLAVLLYQLYCCTSCIAVPPEPPMHVGREGSGRPDATAQHGSATPEIGDAIAIIITCGDVGASLVFTMTTGASDLTS